MKSLIEFDPDRQEGDLATELKLSDSVTVLAIHAFVVSGIPIDPLQLATRADALVAQAHS